MHKGLKKLAAGVLTAILISTNLVVGHADEYYSNNISEVSQRQIIDVKESDQNVDGQANIYKQDGFIDPTKGRVSGNQSEENSNLNSEEVLDSEYGEINVNEVENLDNNLKTAKSFKEIVGKNRYETAIKISQEGWKKGANTVVIVNAYSTMEGIISSPLAAAFDAPILVVRKDTVFNEIKAELKRLNPKTVYMVGAENMISKTVSDQIRATTGATMLRVSGRTLGDTSARIADIISKKVGIEEVYIVSNQNGPADALSIAARAAERVQPILVTGRGSVSTYVQDFLYKFPAKRAYYIGGTSSIDHAVIKIVDGFLTQRDQSKRLAGNDRHYTNEKILREFYSSYEDRIYIAKSKNEALVDSVTLGPLAGYNGAPVLITPTDKIAGAYNNFLSEAKVSEVIQVGGGINPNIVSNITRYLSSASLPELSAKASRGRVTLKPTAPKEKPKPAPTPTPVPSGGGSLKGRTIVLDPGHGGHDSGAVGYGYMEKNLALQTANYAAAYLRNQGARVIMTRTGDNYITPIGRPEMVNGYSPDLFASIHYNASSSPSSSGAEVFYQVRDKNGGTSKSVAQQILNKILSAFSLVNRGIKTRVYPGTTDTDYLAVLRGSDGPAVLVEGGFMSNSGDMNKIAKDPSGLKKMGEAIAKGIQAVFAR